MWVLCTQWAPEHHLCVRSQCWYVCVVAYLLTSGVWRHCHLERDVLRSAVIHLYPLSPLALLSSSSIMELMQEYNPWGSTPHPAKYMAWHIRTPDGETTNSYNPKLHTYITQEPSEIVCGAYLRAFVDAKEGCPSQFEDDTTVVYISSNRCVCCASSLVRSDEIVSILQPLLTSQKRFRASTRNYCRLSSETLLISQWNG